MTGRSHLISAFITPFRLLELLRMPFNNALYGFWKLSPPECTHDIFTDGVPSKPRTRTADRLLDVCEEWHISISVEKSECGVDYLGHDVSINGFGAKPMNLEAVAQFPRSLNYYHHFIPDFVIFVTVLYSISVRNFDERVTNPETGAVKVGSRETRVCDVPAATPMLKHFDVDRQPVVIVYASDWAVSAALTQKHDGVYVHIKYTSRPLKPDQLNDNITEKVIIALLRVFNECHNKFVGR
ncbi:LOW QUALITY PROTEIN: reverse transcriptase [Phytophthora megakarya]|uniref:Reverse transcriptase n=1 Tax=Phytophthora megakarya TaxID=4795 RepID=A0A225WGP7_9STRA|nr:LOW QUALITY PROTEIN: reverse transcriptase [Phytophthora megakarya]